jgi:hypothetical protein
MISIELKIDFLEEDLIPHSFLSVTHPDGTVFEYELSPHDLSSELIFPFKFPRPVH